jgi:uncharacterized protein YhaN
MLLKERRLTILIISDMTATFGNLENRSLSLSEGLNIIEGSNETGKSTWCVFIKSMLYGINTSERDSKSSLAVKNRFRPWSGSPMSGRMKVYTEDLGELILERRTSNQSAPMRDFQAYSILGEEVSLSNTDIGELLLGIDLSCFERSAFIGSPRLPSGGTSELERRILALVSSGDERSSYIEARSALEGWQRKLEYRGRGRIPELEQSLASLKSELDSFLENSAELDALQMKISSLESEYNAMLDRIAEKQKEFNVSIQSRIQEAENRLKKAQQDALAASRTLPSGNPKPTPDELRVLERRFFSEQERKLTSQAQSALLREKQRRADEHRILLSEHKPFGGCSIDKAKELVLKDTNHLKSLTVGSVSRVFFRKLSPFLLIPLVLSVIISVTTPEIIRGVPSWLIPALLVLFSPLVLLAISRSKARKHIAAVTKSILEKYGVKSQDEIIHALKGYVSLVNEYLQTKEEIESNHDINLTVQYSEEIVTRIKDIFPFFKCTTDIENGLSDAVQSAVDAIEDYNRKVSEIHRAEELLNTLKANWLDDSDATLQFTYISDDYRAELAMKEKELSALNRQKALLEGRLSHKRNSTELEYEISQISQHLKKMRQQYSAITVALNTLSDAFRLIRERFSPRLNEETAKIFSALTSNRYSRVIINKEFEAMAGSDSSEGVRRSLELSSGTADQLYLALRLAICRIVLPQSKSVPIILDDALLTFDDTRMAYALEYLYQESKERQIILFTCHRREGAYLKGRPGVNILSLDSIQKG